VFVTDRWSLLGEFKYTRATLSFDGIPTIGLAGDYSAQSVVFGASFNFPVARFATK
jgi:hypothetical protein